MGRSHPSWSTCTRWVRGRRALLCPTSAAQCEAGGSMRRGRIEVKPLLEKGVNNGLLGTSCGVVGPEGQRQLDGRVDCFPIFRRRNENGNVREVGVELHTRLIPRHPS